MYKTLYFSITSRFKTRKIYRIPILNKHASHFYGVVVQNSCFLETAETLSLLDGISDSIFCEKLLRDGSSPQLTGRWTR